MKAENHLTSEERAAYWQGTLGPQALLDLSDHLQECARCREELLGTRPRAETKELSYEELAAWMAGSLEPPARHALAERIAASPQSSAALVDLLRFRDEMDELAPRNFSSVETSSSSKSRWILPLAAGLALGAAFLWLTTIQQNRRGLALRDAGQQIIVRQNGTVPALGPLPPELQNALREATSLGQVTLPPALEKLRGANGVLAGTSETPAGFAVVAPLGTLVEGARPRLRWTRMEGATGYRVNLARKNGAEVISSPLLAAHATEWTPPEALSPNDTYEWEVEALRAGEMIAKAPAPPAPEARFAILPNDQREELEKLRQEYGRSHLVLGLVYAKAGLLPQARAELEKLAQENPGNDLPRKLLESLKLSR